MFNTQGDVQSSQTDGNLNKVHSSYTAASKWDFIGGLLVLSLLPIPSPPPVFALLVMMFGLTDAAQINERINIAPFITIRGPFQITDPCEMATYCCEDSDCSTSKWCDEGSKKLGLGCDKSQCKTTSFSAWYGAGTCKDRRADGELAEWAGDTQTDLWWSDKSSANYDSCKSRIGKCAGLPYQIASAVCATRISSLCPQVWCLWSASRNHPAISLEGNPRPQNNK